MIKFWESKTFWVNLLGALLLAGSLFLPGSQFADLFTPRVSEFIALGMAFVNIILRVFFTSVPVENPLKAK